MARGAGRGVGGFEEFTIVSAFSSGEPRVVIDAVAPHCTDLLPIGVRL